MAAKPKTVQIRVTENYRGRSTNERLIAPGDYAIGDKALYGQGKFLLDTGRAERITVLVEPVPKRETSTRKPPTAKGKTDK